VAGTMTDEAFAEFVQAAWPGLYRTAYLMLGDHQLAEDLVQASLAKTYASWRKIKEPAAAPAYARVVLANTAASWFRRRGWRNEHPTEVLPDAGTEHDLTTRTAVVDALATLAPRQRAVVVLRYYDDLSVREVAHALGISEGTVKSQTSDALARLRDVLDEEAAAVSVPGVDPAAVVGQGRRIQRDRRVRVATAVTAVLAIIGVGIGIGIAAREEPKRISPAEQVYLSEGAWIDGEDVHVGDHTVHVPDPYQVRYTSVGALVAPFDETHGGAGPPLTLIRPDGSTTEIDAPGIQELPGTDPTSSNIAYVRPVGEGYEHWELVVLDLADGEIVATVPYDDKVTIGSGRAPDVGLHGDDALLSTGDGLEVVDWRTGKRTPAASEGAGVAFTGSYGAGLYIIGDAEFEQPVDHWQVRSWTDGSIVSEIPGGQTAELSPDGRYLKVSRSPGFTVYDVRSGEKTHYFGDGYSWSDFGWSPHGHLVGRAPSGSRAAALVSCDPVDGTCVEVGTAHSPQVLFVHGAKNQAQSDS